MASSVELGPGMRLAPPSKSRNSCSLTHLRRWTTSWRIMAMWAAGPPKAMKPSLRKSAATSPRWPERASAEVFSVILSHIWPGRACPTDAAIGMTYCLMRPQRLENRIDHEAGGDPRERPNHPAGHDPAHDRPADRIVPSGQAGAGHRTDQGLIHRRKESLTDREQHDNGLNRLSRAGHR